MSVPVDTRGATDRGGRGHRLFFALWPDDEQRMRLERALRPLLERTGGRHVPATRLHLTLVFLEDVPPAGLDCLRSAAESVRLAPFELFFDRIGYWRHAQVLWLGPRPEAALDALHHRLRAALAPCGLPLEQREFRPHVTLARRLHRRPRATTIEPVAWPVTRFSLIESHSTSGGMEYTEIGAWPLAGKD